MNISAIRMHMTWRRVFWYGLLAALGWGLYLSLPPKPRWVLPGHEVPIATDRTRMVTMELDPLHHDPVDQCRQIHQFQEIVNSHLFSWQGPVRMRDLITGQVLAQIGERTADWTVFHISADFRLILCQQSERNTIAVYEWETGKHWKMNNVIQSYFSPKGSVVHVWLQGQEKDQLKDQLFEAATGQLLAEFSGNHGLRYQFAPDDSWALFTGPVEDTKDHTSQWLLWRRDAGVVAKGVRPYISNLQIAPDGRVAVVERVSPSEKRCRLELWDSRRGEIIRVLESSIRNEAKLIFSPDSTTLAVWSEFEETPLDFIDLASGTFKSTKTVAKISRCAFSPNGRHFTYCEGHFPETIHVIGMPDQKQRWRRSADLDCHSPAWMPSNDSQLLARFFGNGGGAGFGGFGGGGAGQTGARLFNGETGQELLSRPRGDLSLDHRLLICTESGAEVKDRGILGALLAWFPWTKDKDKLNLTIEGLYDRQQVLRRTILYDTGLIPPTVHSPYSDRDLLVLMVNGHDTEIWDLPPARRWLWILGPPAALATLPWLRRIPWRMRSAAASAAQGQAAAPNAV